MLKRRIEDLVERLRNYEDGGLSHFYEKKDDALIIPDELSETIEELFSTLLDKAKDFSDEQEFIEFTNGLAKEGEHDFWQFVNSYIKTKNLVWKETVFLNELDDKVFEELLLFVLNKFIIEYEPVDEHGEFNLGQLRTTYKTLNTLIDAYVVERFSKKHFLKYAQELFPFADNKTQILWDIIYKNKSELRDIWIVQRINSLVSIIK